MTPLKKYQMKVASNVNLVFQKWIVHTVLCSTTTLSRQNIYIVNEEYGKIIWRPKYECEHGGCNNNAVNVFKSRF